MKKLLLIIGLVSIGLTIFSSCKKEETLISKEEVVLNKKTKEKESTPPKNLGDLTNDGL